MAGAGEGAGAVHATALRANFRVVLAHGPDDVARYFYSYLFLRNPQLRADFPLSLAEQRVELMDALGRIVEHLDDPRQLTNEPIDVARPDGIFGPLPADDPAVGEALIATLRHFSGGSWTDRLGADWVAAFGAATQALSTAGRPLNGSTPAWTEATVAEVDRRTFDIAVLTLRPALPLAYVAGQSVPVEARSLRPGERRLYSPANPPGGPTIELHVRLVDGGPVSTALVRGAAPGDRLRLGPPTGRLVIDPTSTRPLLLIAGGTGLAPLKAVVRQLARGQARPTHLYVGSRSIRELYDRRDLEILDRRHPWLTVVSGVSDDIRWTGPTGQIGDIVTDTGDWASHDVLVCGSPAMVEGTIKRLVEAGVPDKRITSENFVDAYAAIGRRIQ